MGTGLLRRPLSTGLLPGHMTTSITTLRNHVRDNEEVIIGVDTKGEILISWFEKPAEVWHSRSLTREELAEAPKDTTMQTNTDRLESRL
mmetsp:Transcript_27870/g.41542  ORF Transcript_27870/g.41542 Transcript_27870/m.41542 type:complete len:89 (+) Transcript_27870:81-347(+)